MSICHQISSYITRLHLWQSTSHSDRHGGFHSPISRGIVESVRHHKNLFASIMMRLEIISWEHLYIYIYIHFFFRHFRGRWFSQLSKGYICIRSDMGCTGPSLPQVLDVIEVWDKKQGTLEGETRWVFLLFSNAFFHAEIKIQFELPIMFFQIGLYSRLFSVSLTCGSWSLVT